jgi:hypothetical protein
MEDEFDEIIVFNFAEDEEFIDEVIEVGSYGLAENDTKACCVTHYQMMINWSWN